MSDNDGHKLLPTGKNIDKNKEIRKLPNEMTHTVKIHLHLFLDSHYATYPADDHGEPGAYPRTCSAGGHAGWDTDPSHTNIHRKPKKQRKHHREYKPCSVKRIFTEKPGTSAHHEAPSLSRRGRPQFSARPSLRRK